MSDDRTKDRKTNPQHYADTALCGHCGMLNSICRHMVDFDDKRKPTPDLEGYCGDNVRVR